MDVDARAITAVQALSGSCCFYAAAEMAMVSLAEAMAAVTDVTASGSSYSSCAAAVTAMDLAASS